MGRSPIPRAVGIPDTQYDATITMSSSEFQRICRDLAALGESVKIEASKEGVRFSSEGEVGTGSVLLKQSAGTDRGAGGSRGKKDVKRDPDGDEEEEEEEEAEVKPDVEDDGGGSARARCELTLMISSYSQRKSRKRV